MESEILSPQPSMLSNVRDKAWGSLVEGDEGSDLPNCQTNLFVVYRELSLLFWHFLNATASLPLGYMSLHLLLLKSSMAKGSFPPWRIKWCLTVH